MKLKIMVVFLLLLSITACGTASKSVELDENGEQTDITRPPTFVKPQLSQKEQVEKDPDEAVSLEEWEKQQEAK